MNVNTRDTVIDGLIAVDAQLLSKQLQRLREKIFPPESKKALRRFSSGETAKLIGVSDSYLRQLSLSKQGPIPETSASGRRHYTLEQVNDLRRYIATTSQPEKQRHFLPHRAGNDHLQVIAVTNFKGGSGKTTTSVHLAQYLALRGYRVLAIDLDPQASLSSLLGFQPEFDLKANETFYGAVRYDHECRPLTEIIRKTYFDGLSIVPANLELHEFEHTTPRILAEGRGVGKDLFFARVERALSSVEQNYDVVVIDCPPQLGFLTLSALCAATSVLVTIHPQMLDVASMSQFLLMTSDLLAVVREAGGDLTFDFFRYVITRHETNDGPQAQIIGFLRSLFGDRVLTNVALKSTAISDAGLSKQTIYEVDREGFSRSTYQRAIESLDAVNGEIESLIRTAWRR
jgi:chromosome partitioning protein